MIFYLPPTFPVPLVLLKLLISCLLLLHIYNLMSLAAVFYMSLIRIDILGPDSFSRVWSLRKTNSSTIGCH